MAATGIVRDDLYVKHITGEYHPESYRRLEVIYEMLEEKEMQGKFRELQPRFATEAEIGMIHTPDYIARVAATANQSHAMLDPDTSACPDTWGAAKLAAGGLFVLVDAVIVGEIDNGFALVRPPGHHAEADRAMGFCIFNNVALAAKHAIKEHSLEKILIVDWDLHHGNATQHSFFDDPQVLYFSTHQFPYYPGTGGFRETGSGKGKGFTINVPLSAGQGNSEYMKIFREILMPVSLEFKPDFILVSAGFDIYYDDPLGGMGVTPEGFACLTESLMKIAGQVCRGRLVIALEGGYHLEGLKDSVKAVLKELKGESIIPPGFKEGLNNKGEAVDPVINKVKSIHQDFWNCFQ